MRYLSSLMLAQKAAFAIILVLCLHLIQPRQHLFALGVSQDHINILQNLYDSTQGMYWDWRNKMVFGPAWSFDGSDPCIDQWQGITCNASDTSGVVTDITLRNMNLTGNLNSDLGNLTTLQSLVITSSRGLTGPLPQSLSNLHDLLMLKIMNCPLKTSIPSSLCVLPRVEVIDLFATQLRSSIPACIWTISTLRFLNVRNNHLTGPLLFPNSSEFPNSFQEIYVDKNALTGTLPDFFALKHVTLFNVNSNYFTGAFPRGFCNNYRYPASVLNGTQIYTYAPCSVSAECNSSVIESLDLSYNHFAGDINVSDASCMHSIINLRLNNWELFAPFPQSVLHLTSLEALQFMFGGITGTLPAELTNMVSVQHLNLILNQLEGPISESICSLTDMYSLNLGYNLLTSEIPACFTRMTSLYEMDLSFNKFHGPIPDTITSITSLNYLYLDHNDLYGTVPESIGNLVKLNELDLPQNHLELTLPASIMRLTELHHLNISFNYLSGPLLPNIFTLSSQYGLVLNDNRFTGTIPNDFANSSLIYLDLSNNKFRGKIPEQIAYNRTGVIGNNRTVYYGLKVLILYGNELRGGLPRSLSTMKHLQTLLVQKNNLSGDLSLFESMINCSLESLDLSTNKFTGSIPSALLRMRNLKTLIMSDNCFDGTLPTPLCDHPSLETLLMSGLSANPRCSYPGIFPVFGYSHFYLHGDIPSCYYTLPSIRTLYMNGNGFTGTLPIKYSPTLQKLAVSNNRLVGSIPDVFSSLRFLELLDLSYNRLSYTVSHINFAENTTKLEMDVNRLSGYIPDGMEDIHLKLDILKGNLFGCSPEHPKPDNDVTHDTYICGSRELDKSISFAFFFYISVLVLIFCVYLCYYYRYTPFSFLTTLFNDLIYWQQQERVLLSYKINPLSRNALRKTMVEYNLNESMFENPSDELDNEIRNSVCRLSLNALDESSNVLHQYAEGENTDRVDSAETSGIADVDIVDSSVISSKYPRATNISMSVLSRKTGSTPSSMQVSRPTALKLFTSTSSIPRDSTMSSSTNIESLETNLIECRQFLRVLHSIRNSAIVLLLVIIVVFLPCYCFFKFYGDGDYGYAFATHTYQYRWFYTSAFLAGETPASLICLFMVALLLLYMYLVHSGHRKHNAHYQAVPMEHFIPPPQKYATLRVVVAMFVTIAANVAIVSAVNGSYVYTFTNTTSTAAQVSTQFGLALFRIVWSASVPFLIHIMAGFCYVSPARKTWIQLLLLIFNSVVAPVAATLMLDYSCFRNQIFGATHVHTKYFIRFCVRFYDDTITCENRDNIEYISDIEPRVIYNNQCASSILRSFLPVLVYTYVLLAIIIPVVYTFMAHVPVRKVPSVLRNFLPSILWPDADESWKFVVKPEVVLSTLNVDILVLLTFGVSSPILAVVIVIAIFVRTLFWRTLLVRYITEINRMYWSEDRLTHFKAFVKIAALEVSCKKVWKSPKSCLYVILATSVIFNSFTIFDMACDEIEIAPATYFPFAMYMFVLVMMVSYYMYDKKMYYFLLPWVKRPVVDIDADMELTDTDFGDVRLSEVSIDELYCNNKDATKYAKSKQTDRSVQDTRSVVCNDVIINDV